MQVIFNLLVKSIYINLALTAEAGTNPAEPVIHKYLQIA